MNSSVVSVEIKIEDARSVESTLGFSSGQLVLSWLTPPEADFYRRNNSLEPTSICPFVTRARVATLDTERLLSGVRFELSAPLADHIFPIAIFDYAHAFWPTVIDGSGPIFAGVAIEPAEKGSATVVLKQITEKGIPSGSTRSDSESRFRHLELDSDVADGHRVCICLPPDYAQSGSHHYPVVFLLPGLGGDEMVRFRGESLHDHTDLWFAGPKRGVILVGINASTCYGSNYLGDESSTWLQFLTRDLIESIDREYRTVGNPWGRALAGHSTGAFNAVQVALMRPGVFGAIAASAPDALDLTPWLLTSTGEIKEEWLAWMRLEEALGGKGQMLSLARSWSPTPDGGYEWPADLTTGQIRAEVLKRWLDNTPMRLVEKSTAQAALRSLEGRLLLTASEHDEFGLFEPTKRFSKRLSELGIEHQFISDERSHFDAASRLPNLVKIAVIELCRKRGDDCA